jgi:hypothetical protein
MPAKLPAFALDLILIFLSLESSVHFPRACFLTMSNLKGPTPDRGRPELKRDNNSAQICRK